MNRTPFLPGSVNETVYLCIRNYPGLFSNRTQVLAHIFAGFDTGWKWVNGRLVDCYGEIPPVDRTEDELFKPYQFQEGWEGWDELSEDRQDFHRRQAAMDEESNLRSRQIWENSLELTTTHGSFRCPKRYRDAPLFNLPVGVNPEWLAARDEVHFRLKEAWKRGDHRPAAPSDATRALAASVLTAVADKKA